MKISFSPKGIGLIDLGNETIINFTNDDPVKWVMVSAKTRSKNGYIERLTDFVPVDSFRKSLCRDIKKSIKKKELAKIDKAIFNHLTGNVLHQHHVKNVIKELEEK